MPWMTEAASSLRRLRFDSLRTSISTGNISCDVDRFFFCPSANVLNTGAADLRSESDDVIEAFDRAEPSDLTELTDCVELADTIEGIEEAVEAAEDVTEEFVGSVLVSSEESNSAVILPKSDTSPAESVAESLTEPKPGRNSRFVMAPLRRRPESGGSIATTLLVDVKWVPSIDSGEEPKRSSPAESVSITAVWYPVLSVSASNDTRRDLLLR